MHATLATSVPVDLDFAPAHNAAHHDHEHDCPAMEIDVSAEDGQPLPATHTAAASAGVEDEQRGGLQVVRCKVYIASDSNSV